jgi:SAM-dependent methyltransferase
MSDANQDTWYDRFFQLEYLQFDDHPDTDLEVEFILQQFAAEKNEKFLDVGCGYGRHLLPIAQRGYDITGLDRSEIMLNRAKASASPESKAIGLVRADMRDLPFLDVFDYCMSLFSSFGYFESEDENFSVLQSISNALLPGGKFLIETANRDFVVRHLVATQIYRPNGMLLIEERQFNALSSRSRVDVTVIQNGEQTRLHHSIRLYTFTELQMLLAAADLAPVSVWGDFQGGEYTCDSPQMIILAERL